MDADAAVSSATLAISTDDFRHATAVLLLSQQPAIPARRAIGSSEGTMILSLVPGNLSASKFARNNSSSAVSVPDAHRKRSALVRRIPSSPASDSDPRLMKAD